MRARMGHAVVFERSHHHNQRVSLTELPKKFAGESLLTHATAQAADIEIMDICRNAPLRIEHVGQPVEAIIRNLDCGEVDVVLAGEPTRAGFGGGQRVENGGLARRRQTDNDEFCGHEREISRAQESERPVNA